MAPSSLLTLTAVTATAFLSSPTHAALDGGLFSMFTSKSVKEIMHDYNQTAQERTVVTTPARHARQIPYEGHLEGTYAVDCVEGTSMWDQNGSPQAPRRYALGATVRYNVPADPTSDVITFELDKTEDSGFQCENGDVPYKRNLVSKVNFKGEITFNGPSPDPSLNGTYQMTRNIASTTWLIPTLLGNKDIQQTVDYLNQNCSCGVTWKTGVQVTALAANCKGVTKDSGDLCRIIAGEPIYNLYKWIDDFNPRNKKFLDAPSSLDSTEGWYFPQFPSNAVPATQVPESDAHDPNDCVNALDPTLISRCKTTGIFDDVPDYCDGCVDLECTGCIWRHLNHTKSEFANAYSSWTQCCPCIWWEGSRYGGEFSWMDVEC